MTPADFPLASFFHEALSHGTLPLWDDRIGIGYPRYAEGQIGAFYPPNWLIYQLPPLVKTTSSYRVAAKPDLRAAP
jgi:hypothetical protein